MNSIKLFISLIIINSAFGQKYELEFNVIQFDTSGKIFNKHVKSIKSDTDSLDLFFYERYFSYPYDLPDKFHDEKYKNDTIVIWNDPTGKRQEFESSHFTYVYDSLSRIVLFSFSSCGVCSKSQYKYEVTYNKMGQITQLEDSSFRKNEFRFKYNSEGNIVKLSRYFDNKRIMTIELINNLQ